MEVRTLQFVFIAVLMTIFGPAQASEELKFDNLRAHALCAEIESDKYRRLCEAQVYRAVFDEKALEICAANKMAYDRYSCVRAIRNKIFTAQSVSLCKKARYPDHCLAHNAEADLQAGGRPVTREARAIMSAFDKTVEAYRGCALPEEVIRVHVRALEAFKAELTQSIFTN